VRILVVEDEPKVASFVQKQLADEGFDVEVARDGAEALARIGTIVFDLFVLDIALPDLDGFELCRRIRGGKSAAPILMLSARQLVEDRVRALDTGADDYLTKPFAMVELSARVRALLRRRSDTELHPLVIADLTVDPLTRQVRRGGRKIDLTPKEFALLAYLSRHAGQPVTRAMIAQEVWGLSWQGLTNVIDVFVNHLRRKVELPSESRLLHAVRGVGYVLREPHPDDD
jgi:DNA-binding response OmpR family regulator